jgi:iron complex transport system substrate-binding protein
MVGVILRRQDRDTQRIVSLAPNVTSILFALGAEQQLVAVSRWCKTVAEVGARTQLGDCWKLDIAKVMRLKPQLLIGSVPFATEVVSRILEQPVNFLAVNPRCLADIENDIRTLGRLVNRASRAERLIHEMRQSLEDIRGRANRIRDGGSKPRVYCEAWPNPRISSPPWVSELVDIAGGRIVVRAGARVTDDEVAQAMPEVIVLAWAAAGGRSKPEQALRNRRWRKVPAVRAKRVFVIRDELLNTPGPPLMKGALELLHAIHPKLKTE